jgi:hypothetical protein
VYKVGDDRARLAKHEKVVPQAFGDVGVRAKDLSDWASYEARSKARALRLANAANGFRRPVLVMDGNYQVTSGVCP